MSTGPIELVLESFVSMGVDKELNERSLANDGNSNALLMRKIIGVLLHLRQKNVLSTSLSRLHRMGSLCITKQKGFLLFPPPLTTPALGGNDQ